MAAAFLALLVGVALALFLYPERLPTHLNPFAPLDFDEPPNRLTRFKLRRLTADAAACKAFLGTTPLTWSALDDRVTGEGCGFEDAVQVSATTAEVRDPFSLSCRAAVSLALWERHSLQPAALEYFGEPVARLEHFGSYACRSIYGREGGRRSQHATADAFDFAGVVLRDGRRIRVAQDWNASVASGEGDEAAFLRTIRSGACRYFDAVLSPDYNAAHADHFHLDRGRATICR